MPDTTATDPLDAELRRVAQALVDEAPDVPPLHHHREITSVVRRNPSRRRHRVAAIAAAAAVLTLVAGVLAVIGGDGGSEPDGTVLAAGAGLEAAPQRLILDGWRRELSRGGDTVRLELAGLAPHGPPRPLPGGGHVVVGTQPIEDPPVEDSGERGEPTYGLAVVDARGRVEVERDVEPSTLVGVTATDAILSRQPHEEGRTPEGPVTIVAHDLASGEERLVRRGVTFDPDRRASARWAVIAGDLVTVEASRLTVPMDEDVSAVVPGSEACTLRVTDLGTGEESERPLGIECSMVLGLQASPDGSRAAVAYERGSGPADSEVRLAVLDLPSGAVGQDELLGHPIDCRTAACPPGARPIDYQGMAWDDASAVRVAMSDLATRSGDLLVDTVPVD